MPLALFLLLINLFKLWVARFLPLLGDEAYYNLWSKYPALSYVDHPPMIAWLHRLVGQSEFGVRLMAIALVLIATGLIYLIAKEAFSTKVGIAAAVLFNLIPTYLAGGFFLTPELPLIIFWLLALYFTTLIIKTQKRRYWYLLGLAVGLGILSKFSMVLFIPGLFLFLFLSKENRKWFFKKELYFSAIIAFSVASPVIIWNIQNSFPSLIHHGSRLSSPDYIGNLVYFLVLQFLMYSPALFVFSVSAFFYDFWKNFTSFDRFTLFFMCTSVAAFAPFFFISPVTMVGGHWTSVVYLGMIILLCQRIVSANLPIFKNAKILTNLIIIVLLNVLVISYYAFLYPIPEDLKGKAYSLNHQLDEYIKEAQVDYVFSNQMGVGSLAAFYGKTNVYLPQGYWKQFDLWGHPELKIGNDILYFAFNDKKMQSKLSKVFSEAKLDPEKRLFAKDSDIPIKTQVIRCSDYLGGKLP